MEDDYQKYNSLYTSSYMNNSKWMKLFKAVDNSGIEVAKSEWHFIDCEIVLIYPMPSKSDLLCDRFRDGCFQPFEYKWIEKILIPSSYVVGSHTIEQDTSALLYTIQKVGQFATELTDRGLWIHAYKS